MEFVSAEASQAESGVNVTSQPGASSCDEDVDNERLDDGTSYSSVIVVMTTSYDVA